MGYISWWYLPTYKVVCKYNYTPCTIPSGCDDGAPGQSDAVAGIAVATSVRRKLMGALFRLRYIDILGICTTRCITYIYIYTWECITINVYIYTYLLACMHAYIHTCMHAYIHPCIHTYIHTYVHTYIHACIHAYMHTCIHAYMHTT